jgi:hypothetical protein
MATVHEVLNLPKTGKALSLGPVSVKQIYPAETTANGKLRRKLKVADASGESYMTVWGDSGPALNVGVGATVTFQGAFKRNEYNGAVSISAENVALSGGSSSAPAAAAAAPYQAAARAPEVLLPAHELAKQMATFTYEFDQALIQMGYDSNELRNQLVVRAPEFAALWWFGAKGLNLPKDEEVEEEGNPF